MGWYLSGRVPQPCSARFSWKGSEVYSHSLEREHGMLSQNVPALPLSCLPVLEQVTYSVTQFPPFVNKSLFKEHKGYGQD